MKYLEQTIRPCRKCGTATVHSRPNSKTTLLGLAIHLCLAIVTGGIWLAVLLIYKVCTIQIGGWKCQGCAEREAGMRLNRIAIQTPPPLAPGSKISLQK